jgi:integrase
MATIMDMAKDKVRDKGTGAVYQRKDGRWIGSFELYSPDGKRRRKVVSARTEKECQQKLEKAKREFGGKAAQVLTPMTTAQWLEKWMTEIVPGTRRPKTAKGYKSVVDNHLTPALGKVKLAKVTPTIARNAYAAIAQKPKNPRQPDGPRLSATYVNNCHNILSAALADAVREGLLPSNPVEDMRAPAKGLSEQGALTLDQAISTLAYAASDAEWGALWATFLLTGARRGEVLGIEADRVTGELDMSWQLQYFGEDPAFPSDYEVRSLDGGYYLVRPKSGAGWRVLPMFEPLASILRQWIKATGRTGLIFTRPDGSPLNPDVVSNRWLALMDTMKIPQHVTLHGTRHTVADLLYEAGVSEADIQIILGHSSRVVSRGYRTRGNQRVITEALEKMGRMLTGTS